MGPSKVLSRQSDKGNPAPRRASSASSTAPPAPAAAAAASAAIGEGVVKRFDGFIVAAVNPVSTAAGTDDTVERFDGASSDPVASSAKVSTAAATSRSRLAVSTAAPKRSSIPGRSSVSAVPNPTTPAAAVTASQGGGDGTVASKVSTKLYVKSAPQRAANIPTSVGHRLIAKTLVDRRNAAHASPDAAAAVPAADLRPHRPEFGSSSSATSIGSSVASTQGAHRPEKSVATRTSLSSKADIGNASRGSSSKLQQPVAVGVNRAAAANVARSTTSKAKAPTANVARRKSETPPESMKTATGSATQKQ